MPRFEQLELTIGPLIFDALAAGPADGDLVVLLHGFPETAYEWKGQLEALGAAGYRVVAPDQRGYSPRARPLDVEAYAVEHLASDVLAIVDDLGGHRFHLVGHDWGCGPAWYIGSRWGDRLKTLTSVSVPHPKAFAAAHRGDLAGGQREKSAYMDFFRMEGTAEDAMLPTMRDLYTGQGLAPDAVEAHLRVFGEREGLTGGLNWYRANRLESLDVDEVDVPTMLIWSDGDAFLAREGAEATHRWVRGPYRFEVLEGIDHWVPEKAADRVNELLLEHFAAHS